MIPFLIMIMIIGILKIGEIWRYVRFKCNCIFYWLIEFLFLRIFCLKTRIILQIKDGIGLKPRYIKKNGTLRLMGMFVFDSHWFFLIWFSLLLAVLCYYPYFAVLSLCFLLFNCLNHWVELYSLSEDKLCSQLKCHNFSFLFFTFFLSV